MCGRREKPGSRGVSLLGLRGVEGRRPLLSAPPAERASASCCAGLSCCRRSDVWRHSAPGTPTLERTTHPSEWVHQGLQEQRWAWSVRQAWGRDAEAAGIPGEGSAAFLERPTGVRVLWVRRACQVKRQRLSPQSYK